MYTFFLYSHDRVQSKSYLMLVLDHPQQHSVTQITKLIDLSLTLLHMLNHTVLFTQRVSIKLTSSLLFGKCNVLSALLKTPQHLLSLPLLLYNSPIPCISFMSFQPT
uniref:4-hydroxy-3-methylbut-2-en-1-yl diphosphate synthase n=1 Tax=Lygus hesperus TaxID=30085 RepID=A0A0A9W5B5_LYGHE